MNSTAKANSPERSASVSKLQNFTLRRVNRESLVAAPWNPRQIDDQAKKKLKANLKKVGLVQPIIWNKQTGHIVAGHQRLELLDQLEGRKNYALDVAEIDVPEKTEKEINVFLNNELAQGTWDIQKLDVLMNDGVDILNCGFEKFELGVLLPSFSAPMNEALKNQTAEVGAVVADVEEDLKKKREMRKQIKDSMQSRDQLTKPEIYDTELYIVLVFKNREAGDAFLNLMRLPITEKYISGDVVHTLVQQGISASEAGSTKVPAGKRKRSEG